MESSLITVDPRRFNKRLSMEFTKKVTKIDHHTQKCERKRCENNNKVEGINLTVNIPEIRTETIYHV